jgi:hypothetical protein
LRSKAANDGARNIVLAYSSGSIEYQCKRTHPKAGPANGANKNKLVAIALNFGGNKSAFVPAPTAKTGLPVVPARNLQTRKPANELLNPAPRVKSMEMGRLKR